MSHEKTILGLKGLIKRSIFTIDPKEHVKHVQIESDRAAIILSAGIVETGIVDALERKMTCINSDEKERLFNYEGPVGSFSNRIRLAQALGIFDRSTRRRIEIIKEMRNAAAHSHLHITFDTPEIREGLNHLFDNKYRKEILTYSNQVARVAYSLVCSSYMSWFVNGTKPREDNIIRLIQAAQRQALHGRSQEA